LLEVLEDWLLYRIAEKLEIPAVDGHKLGSPKASV
jgi:hypothetical protein